MSPRIAHSLLVAALVAVGGSAAGADRVGPSSAGAGGSASDVPPELVGVDVEEKPGAVLPLDLGFRDDSGAPVRLRDLIARGKPVIVTFNYSNCPMLCSTQLGGLVETLGAMRWSVGEEFDVITVGLDPEESHRQAFDTKLGYLERYDRERADLGWHFLTGDEASIRALADSVGFGYRYHEERAEYLHPATLILASPMGQVSGYLYGVSYDPEELQGALATALVGGTSEATRKFILSCFHYEAPTGFAAVAMKAMRYGGVLFVVGLIAAFGVARARRKAQDASSGE